MPHPEGAKLMYISPELMKEYPQLNSHNLQSFLWSIQNWKDKIIWKKEMKEYLKNNPNIQKIFNEVLNI